MKYLKIYEDAEFDYKLTQEAAFFANILYSFLNVLAKRPMLALQILHKVPDGWAFPVEAMVQLSNSSYMQNHIAIKKLLKNQVVIVLQEYDDDAPASYGSGNIGGINARFIFLKILNDANDPIDLSTLNNFNASAIAHEYMHFFDDTRYKDPNYSHEYDEEIKDLMATQRPLTTKRHWKLYYSNPSEFQAIYQQMVTNLIGLLNSIDNAKRRKILNNFKLFLEVLTSTVNPNYKEDLNKKYKRKFIKRAYGLFVLLRENPDYIDNPGYAQDLAKM